MSQSCTAAINVNGKPKEIEAGIRDTLLTVLRDQLALTGAKRGCNQGVCGACTVLSDGRPVRSCLSLALNCGDSQIKTVEGLLDDPVMISLQNAFIANAAFQCGFCTSGMLTAATALLHANPAPAREDVSKALSGNLCRCTGYKKIIDAVLAASFELQGRVPK
jgi:aerobic-type carbon monoxide dehydrogenase small subunit (CoxS/CutS family)